MANNKIQIKRTSTAGRTPNTTNAANSQYIAAGEFALNMTDQILYTSDGSNLIPVGANLANQRITNSLTIDNNKNLQFRTVNTAASVSFIQQSDDNFVMYSTNTAYGQRAIFSVFANSNNSEFSFSAPVRFNANVTALTANGTLGTAGQVLASNGSAVYWVSPGAASVNTAAQFTWTNTHTFQANVSFTGNGIGISTNTGAVYLNGLTDANWRIGRNTGATTKWRYTNNSIDIITANSNLEGMTIGLIGGNSYFETGYLGTYIASNVTVGNTSSNVSINSTSFSVGSTFVANSTTLNANGAVINSTGAFVSGTVNATTLSVGSNFIANSSRLVIGTTVGVQANGGIGTAGQVLASNGSTVYWTNVSSAVEVTIQNTNPSTPNNGRVYWNSDLGKLMVYYNDGDSVQWVEAHVAGQTGPTGPAGPIAGTTNQISFNDGGFANGSSNLVFYKANNTFNTNSAIFSGAVSITGNTVITGTANISGNAVISGSANVGVNLNVTANAAITGNLTVSGTGGITFSDATTLTSGAAIGFRNMEVYTSNGTWTVPASLRVPSGKWKVTLIGAGAQGGGTSTTAGQVGGGGGSGAVSIGFYSYASGVNSMTYNIGIGGAGAGTNATGNNGTASNTTYNAVVINAGGGSGGAASGAGGAGGTATGGTLNLSGDSGDNGGTMAATSNYIGNGADTPLGYGSGGEMPVTAAGATGVAGTNYGAGGSGGRNGTGVTARAGGAGTGGLLIIEY